MAALVQSKLTRQTASATTTTATFTSNVTAGNLIAVMASWDGGIGVLSGIADNLGNTYTAVNNISDGGNPNHYHTWYAKNITGGACTVTVTYTSARPITLLEVAEISGLDTTAPLDKSAIQLQATPGTGTDAVTSGSVTTTTDGQFIFGCSIATGSFTQTYSVGTGFTVIDNVGTSVSDRALCCDYKIQSTAGAIAATATQTNNQNVVTAIMTFKTVAGPTITSVSTGTPREGASLTITGTTFGASQGSGDVKINGVAQTVTAWSATSITVTVVLGTNKFGAAYNVVVRDNSLISSNSYAGITGLLPANSGLSYVDIGTPNATAANRITASGDLASGDQLEYENKGGAVTVATDGTFTVALGTNSFSCRLWSTGVGYGTSGLQSTGGLPGDRRFLKMSPNIKLGW